VTLTGTVSLNSPRCRLRAIALALVAPAGLAGRANIWGFQVVTEEPGGDAVAGATELDAADSGSSSVPSTPPEGGAREGDGQGPSGSPPMPPDGGGDADGREAGEHDARLDDGGHLDSGAIAPCGSGCAGCCDGKGQCRGGRSITVCGGAGLACVDCSATTCALLYGPCCGGANGCGCQLLSLGLVQCQ
jgi:hypothetical protein